MASCWARIWATIWFSDMWDQEKAAYPIQSQVIEVTCQKTKLIFQVILLCLLVVTFKDSALPTLTASM